MLSIRKKDIQQTKLLESGGMVLVPICANPNGETNRKHKNGSKKGRNNFQQHVETICHELGSNAKNITLVIYLTHPNQRFNKYTIQELKNNSNILKNYENKANQWKASHQNDLKTLQSKNFKVVCKLSSDDENNEKYLEALKFLEYQYTSGGKEKNSFYQSVIDSAKKKSGDQIRRDIATFKDAHNGKISENEKQKIIMSNNAKACHYVIVEAAMLLAISEGKIFNRKELSAIIYSGELNPAMKWVFDNHQGFNLSFSNNKVKLPTLVHVDSAKKMSKNHRQSNNLSAPNMLNKSHYDSELNRTKMELKRTQEEFNKTKNEFQDFKNEVHSKIDRRFDYLDRRMDKLSDDRNNNTEKDNHHNDKKYIKKSHYSLSNICSVLFYCCSKPDDGNVHQEDVVQQKYTM